MSILFFILLIFLFVFVLIFSMLRGVVSFFLGKGKKQQHFNNNDRRHSQPYANDSEDSKKVFSPDEGEYVKYEEIE